MIKHDYQKKNEDGAVRSESRNKQRYDATVIASEKSKMRMLDSRRERDVGSYDFSKQATQEEIPVVRKGTVPAAGDRSDSKRVGASDRSSVMKSDLEKHIDESERYYIDITNSHRQSRNASAEESKPKKPIPSTVEIRAFEPQNISFPNGEEQDTVVFSKKIVSGENAVSDTGMMTTVRTAHQESRETRAFMSYSSEQTDGLGKTVDISSIASEEVSVPPMTQELPKQEEEKPSNGFEYTSAKQNKQIASDMRSKCVLSKVRISMAILLSVALFLIENISVVKALFATQIAYIMVDWLLAFACAVLIFDRLCAAFKSIFKLKPDADCIALIAFMFSIAATALALLFETPESHVTLYNFPFALCVLLDTLFVYYSLRRDIYSFSILSAPQEKHAVILREPSEKTSLEEEISVQEGDMGNKYGEMKRVNFIDGYFAHKEELSGAKLPLRIILLFCFCISVVFFVCSLFVMRHSVSESIVVAYATFMMCAPFSAFLAYSYPAYLAARRTHSYQSAILCDKTPDSYHDLSMLVFRDTEVFSSGQAKVKSIRLYADKKIDNAIYYASSIYSAIGGPLAEVFKNAALNSVSSENVEIREVCPDGACAMVDGRNIVIGKPSYMEEQCFETVNDPGDEEYEGKTNKRIFYLACDQIVIAKFYIQYTVSSDFLEIASRLFSAGIGIGVATADPCLDIGIFYENKIDPEQNAIRVLKGCLDEPAEESVSAKKAGVISIGNTMDLVKSTLLCGKLENVKKTHLVLKAVSSILGVAVMALILFTGKAPEMNSVYPALYQLFWLLPAYFVSKVYL